MKIFFYLKTGYLSLLFSSFIHLAVFAQNVENNHEWIKLKQASLDFLIEIQSFYPNYEIYFIGNQSPYLKVLFKEFFKEKRNIQTISFTSTDLKDLQFYMENVILDLRPQSMRFLQLKSREQKKSQILFERKKRLQDKLLQYGLSPQRIKEEKKENSIY